MYGEIKFEACGDNVRVLQKDKCIVESTPFNPVAFAIAFNSVIEGNDFCFDVKTVQSTDRYIVRTVKLDKSGRTERRSIMFEVSTERSNLEVLNEINDALASLQL